MPTITTQKTGTQSNSKVASKTTMASVKKIQWETISQDNENHSLNN